MARTASTGPPPTPQRGEVGRRGEEATRLPRTNDTQMREEAMQAVLIPVEGEITTGHDIEFSELFGDTATEIVHFGIPRTRTMYLAGDEDSDDVRWVVMLVDDEGVRRGRVPNPRATILYRGGRHQGVIFGDAYLVMEQDLGPEYGRDLVDIEAPYDSPQFWQEVVTT